MVNYRDVHKLLDRLINRYLRTLLTDYESVSSVQFGRSIAQVTKKSKTSDAEGGVDFLVVRKYVWQINVDI